MLAVILTPMLGYVMWKASKPHTEQVEDSNALAASITAIGEAAVKVVGASTDVSEMMQGFLAPLRAELEEQKQHVAELTIKHNAELDQIRQEFTKSEELCSYRLDVLSDHVQLLRAKMRANDIDPGPPPELDGFTFD